MKSIALLQRHGVVHFLQDSALHPVTILFELKGFEPHSVHAVHIHEYGDLRKGCVSLGGHFNPTKQPHGQHAGDLFYNFETDSEGVFTYRYETPHISLFHGPKCILGRSIVIHAFPDDYGLGGVFDNDILTRYDEMGDKRLQSISRQLGYPVTDRTAMIRKLEHESQTTGNASTRLDCGIIGLCDPK